MAKRSASDFFSSSTGGSNTIKKTPAEVFFSRTKKEMDNSRTEDFLDSTLNSVMKPVAKNVETPKETPYAVDFMAAQAAQKEKPKTTFETKFSGILPAASAVNTGANPLSTKLKEKIPAAQLLQPTGGGPSNASQIPGISQYEINKKEIESAPPVIKQYAQAMNYLTEGNPLGIAIGNAFSGNSGSTRRDSSGNATVDKIANVVNNFVTPALIPTGAPYGQGIVGSTYEAAGKALSKGVGQSAVNTLAKAVPFAGRDAAQNIARVGLTEGLAGAAQGAGFGVQQGQDTGKEIARNAAFGAAGGFVLGSGGAAIGEAFPAIRGLFKKNGIPDSEIDEITGVLSLPEGRGTARQSSAANRSMLSANNEPVVNPYTFDLPEASAGTMQRSANASEGRAGVREIDQQIHDLQTSYEQRVIDEYKTLKSHRDKPSGVNQGNMTFDDAGNVTAKFGRSSNNPVWYQEAMKENSYRRLTNKQLYELARKHVDEGFNTEVGRVPSWKQENGFNEQMNALQQYREQLIKNVQEVSPAITVTDAPLVENKLKGNNAVPRTANKSTFSEVPAQPVNKLAEAPIPAREPVASAVSDVPKTREQALYDKDISEWTPEDIAFSMSPEFNNANIVETPKVTVKADEVAPTVKKPAPAPKERVTEPKPKSVDKVEGERGFYRTLKNSGKVDKAVKLMDPKYEPISNQTSLDGANNRIKDLEEAKNDILGRKLVNAEDGATAMRLVQEYTRMGDNKTAALISGKAAEDLTTAGQLVQSAAMWNRLSPEGMLLRVQREIAKVNETLSPIEEKMVLSTADETKIIDTGNSIQKAQSVRDLAGEVMEMINKKVPGTQLTPEEKTLLQTFENKVKEVNDSVKPFMKKVKSEAEKIAKIKPENRTRDQVVTYLDQKAAEARARLERSRNIGFAAKASNPVIDYSIIGAAKIARGIRTFADFSEDMVKTLGDDFKKYADEVFVKSTNMYRRENGLPTTTQLERVIKNATKDFDLETAKSLRRMAAEIGYYTDENIKRELTQDLQEVIKTYGKSTFGDKSSAIQTAAQLLSVPTFERNALGNAGQFALEKISKVTAVPIDWTLSKFTGQRTIKFFPHNQEKGWKNLVFGTKSGWRGVDTMGTLSSYNVKPNVFGDKNPLKYLVKLTGASLQGMDHMAYRAAYGDVMATYAEQLGKSQGLSKVQIKERMPELLIQLDDRVKELANKAGLYATYQDETLLSKAAQGTKKALNAPTDFIARKAVEKGLLPNSASWEGFGVGDIVLKYAKTPANLVMRGIDYSPLGFMRSLGELLPIVKGQTTKALSAGAKSLGKTELSSKLLEQSKTTLKSFNQFEFTRALSRAITGTVGLSGLGYILADAGILTGSSSMDMDKRSIEEQSGKGAYKANISGLIRWFYSGFDKDAAQFQKGDKMIDYAWIQPAAISLGMGVNFRQAQDAPAKNNVSMAQKTILGGLRTVLENPMVTGLSDVIGGVSDVVKRQDTKKLKGIAKGIPASFVPSLLGQVRTATDNKQRETYDANLLKEMLNIVENKVPGLSKKLPISYDSLGNERERVQNGKENTLGQYLNSFLNPTKFTTYDVSPEAKTVLDVLNESGDNGVLPRIGMKYIMVTDPETKKDVRVNLTKEQFSRFQKTMGSRVKEEIAKKMEYLNNPDKSIDKKAKKLSDILDKVGSEVRNEFRVEMGYKKKR